MHIILYYTATELYKLEREMSKLYCAHFSAELATCVDLLRARSCKGRITFGFFYKIQHIKVLTSRMLALFTREPTLARNAIKSDGFS